MSNDSTIMYEVWGKSLTLDTLRGRPFVRLVEGTVSTALKESGQVLVEWHAGLIDMADLMCLMEEPPVKPLFHPLFHIRGHPILGSGGCGRVLTTNSSRFEVGDTVVPRELGLGTWRTHAIVSDKSLIKIPNVPQPHVGALLRSSAMVAYLLITQVRKVQMGEWIIINAGTGTVAHFLLQLAHVAGIYTVVVIRDRVDFWGAHDHLVKLGATSVLQASELHEAKLPFAPVMAVDFVSGVESQHLVKHLAPRGTLVLVATLGSSQMSFDSTLFLTKGLQLLSFSAVEQISALEEKKAEEIMRTLVSMAANGSLVMPMAHALEWSSINQAAMQGELLDAIAAMYLLRTWTVKLLWLPHA